MVTRTASLFLCYLLRSVAVMVPQEISATVVEGGLGRRLGRSNRAQGTHPRSTAGRLSHEEYRLTTGKPSPATDGLAVLTSGRLRRDAGVRPRTPPATIVVVLRPRPPGSPLLEPAEGRPRRARLAPECRRRPSRKMLSAPTRAAPPLAPVPEFRTTWSGSRPSFSPLGIPHP